MTGCPVRLRALGWTSDWCKPRSYLTIQDLLVNQWDDNKDKEDYVDDDDIEGVDDNEDDDDGGDS